jgi:hypothetical protein
MGRMRRRGEEWSKTERYKAESWKVGKKESRKRKDEDRRKGFGRRFGEIIKIYYG